MENDIRSDVDQHAANRGGIVQISLQPPKTRADVLARSTRGCEYLGALLAQTAAEMRAEKTSRPGDHYSVVA